MSYSKKPKTIDPNDVDPSVYYYDEVYDDMKTEENPSTSLCNIKQKGESKYIKGLIETAEQRKTDKEIRKFKKYTRDKIEAESRGDLEYTDVYITPSYKNKLEEIKRLEEVKKRRTDDEKDHLMNFAKKARQEEPLEICDQKISAPPYKECSPPTEQNPQDIINDEEIDSAGIRRPLKTIEDRREFLKEILAKRTVGPLFEAALLRYKERRRARNRS